MEDCGKLPSKAIVNPNSRIKSRIVNAKESNTWYPWMTYISVYDPMYDVLPNGKPDKVKKEYVIAEGHCTGSIISLR